MLKLLVVLVAALTSVRGEITKAAGFKTIPQNFPAGENWDQKAKKGELKEYGDANGLFTGWMSADDSATYGLGDFEGVNKQLAENTAANCPMWCDNPAGVEWRLVDIKFEARIDECIQLDTGSFAQESSSPNSPTPGFLCMDSYQTAAECTKEECIAIGMNKGNKRMEVRCDHCPNFEVRYLCPAARPTATYCPGLASKRNLLDKMQELDDQMEAKGRELEQLNEKAVQAEKREATQQDDAELESVKSLLRELLELKRES